MNVQEIAAEREKIASEIRNMGEKFEKSSTPWSSNDEKKWDELNADHDRLVKQLNQARDVTERRKLVEDFDSQANNPHGVGYNHGGEPTLISEGRRGSGPMPAEFMCASTGRAIEVLSHSERIQSPGQEAGPRVGELIRAAATGQSIRGGEYATQIVGDDPSGGFTAGVRVGAGVVDLARSPSIAMKAGANTVSMDTGELIMIRQTADPEPGWRRELQDINSTSVLFDKIVLRPKVLAAVIPISMELLEDSSNAVSAIEHALGESMGLALDRAILFGNGSVAEPLGITNTEGVQSIALDGIPTGYQQLTRAVEQIKTANYDGEPEGLAWMCHPRDAATYDGLVDGEGQPLMPTPWASKLKKYHTTSFATNQGDGENE